MKIFWLWKKRTSSLTVVFIDRLMALPRLTNCTAHGGRKQELCNRSTTFRFITAAYRKPTHTGLYSKWSGLIPLHKKRNLINSLLRRAYDIASTCELLYAELINVKRMLCCNSYTSDFWTVAFSNFWTESTVLHNAMTHWLSFTQMYIITSTYLGALYLTAYGKNSDVL